MGRGTVRAMGRAMQSFQRLTSLNRLLLRLRRYCQQNMDGADSILAEKQGLAQGCHTNTANAEHRRDSSAMPASSVTSLSTMKPSRMHLLYMRACEFDREPDQAVRDAGSATSDDRHGILYCSRSSAFPHVTVGTVLHIL
jgi:hypothetical protein